MAITTNPEDATSDKKLMCSQGELAQAPFPHTIIGSLLFFAAAFKSEGLKTVWVGRELSETIRALKGPVPPSSTTREEGTVSCADTRFVKQIPVPINKTNSAYVLFIINSI
jgi:hypothetical protein